MNARQLAGVALAAGIVLFVVARLRASGTLAVGADGQLYPVRAGQDGFQGAIAAGAGLTPSAATEAAYRAAGGPAGGGAGLVGAPYVGEYDAPSFGSAAGRAGLAAGTALGTSVGTALVGPGTVAAAVGPAALAATGIGAGAALLTWAVVNKGLFRGGEEGIKVNPSRDAFLLQFGPGGWNYTEPMSGAPKLAQILAEISAWETNGTDNQVYDRSLMTPLLKADTMEKFVPVTRQIRDLLGRYGVGIDAF